MLVKAETVEKKVKKNNANQSFFKVNPLFKTLRKAGFYCYRTSIFSWSLLLKKQSLGFSKANKASSIEIV